MAAFPTQYADTLPAWDDAHIFLRSIKMHYPTLRTKKSSPFGERMGYSVLGFVRRRIHHAVTHA